MVLTPGTAWTCFCSEVNSREFFVEVISSPVCQFLTESTPGGSEQLSVLPADSLDSKEISFIDPL